MDGEFGCDSISLFSGVKPDAKGQLQMKVPMEAADADSLTLIMHILFNDLPLEGSAHPASQYGGY